MIVVTDPDFELILSNIRGFDLGDDQALLAELEGRRQTEPDALSGSDWLLLGVLYHRQGRREAAASALEHAAAQRHAISLTRYVQSHFLRLIGHHDEAAAVLDLAEEAAHDDELVSPAAFAHARAQLAWAQGDREAALARLEEALERTPNSASRWLQTGMLLTELERGEAAEVAFRRALAEEPDLHHAMYERAVLSARQGSAYEACEWLEQAILHDESHRARARTDPRFDPVRSDPQFVSLSGPVSPGNLDWLDGHAPWLNRLREDPSAPDLQWLDQETSGQISENLRRAYKEGPAGTLHTEHTLSRSRALLLRRVCIAQGPSTQTRDRVVEHSLLFVDPEDPDSLYLALSPHYPPYLWIPVATTSGGLRLALSEFFPKPNRTRVDMVGEARGFMGYRERFALPNAYTGEPETADVEELDSHFTINPFVESGSWGSAYPNDPWPDEIPAQHSETLKVAARQERVNAQAPGSVWSVTRRTRHSRSYLTVEVHHRDILVAEVRYQPSRHTEVVRGLNATFGTDYPIDMPVDAIAALMGFQFESTKDLSTRLDIASDADEIAGLLEVVSALRHSDLSVVRLYRRYMGHPDQVVRATLCNIFAAYNHESLLEEMTAFEKDDALREQIESLLDQGIEPSDHDPYVKNHEESGLHYLPPPSDGALSTKSRKTP